MTASFTAFREDLPMDAQQRPARIVIAEDSLVDAELAARAIRRHRILADVVVATNEEELRAALRAAKPDVIISDYSMTTMDGRVAFEIARELTPVVPFIFLSGSVLRLAAGTKHVDGAFACLDKSDLDKLGNAVLKALQRAK
jgi:CheY-like chemotaxis protein